MARVLALSVSIGVPVKPMNDATVWSKKSCDLPVVVLQKAAQSLFAAHFAIAGTHALFGCWKEQNISYLDGFSLDGSAR